MKSLVIGAVLLVPTVVQAEIVSLKEALDRALQRNQLVKIAGYERAAAAGDASMSRSRYLPRVSLEETFSLSSSPTRTFMMKLDQGRFTQADFAIDRLNNPSSQSDFLTALTLEQPLFDLTLARNVELSEQTERSRGFALEGRRQDIALKVFEACLDVQKGRAFLGVAEQAVTAAREHVRLARLKNEAGIGLKSDELRARTHLAEMEQEGIAARNGLHLAHLRLAQLTGGKPGELLDVAGEIRVPEVSLALEQLVRLALEKRQDLKEVETAMTAADVGLRRAQQAYFPTIYARAGLQMNDRDLPFGHDHDAWIAGISLRWDLFDGMRHHALEKARALQMAAGQNREHAYNEVHLQVREQILRYEEAAHRLAVAREAVRDAEEGARLVAKRFENALAGMVDLLDAATALTRTRARLVENENNYTRAVGRVHAAAGIFLEEVVK